MVKLIDPISHGVPNALIEIVMLGRTLKKRADDVVAYFDQLHRQITTRVRRLQTPTTPWIVNSAFTYNNESIRPTWARS